MEYEPISDWTQPARAALVETRGAEIRLLLDTAFTELCDTRDLAAFGFRGDDLVASAVEWCVARFAQGELDPGRLPVASRSFRLFTEVHFWLAQKVGAHQLNRLLQPPQPALPTSALGVEDLLAGLREGLGRALRTLRHRTCADLVTYWLRGSQRVLALLGKKVPGEAPLPPASNKTRLSVHVHDARFRFQCLYRHLVDDTSSRLEAVAVREILFSACENAVPYRRPAAEVAPALPGPTRGAREIRHLCQDGAAELLATLVERLSSSPDGVVERLDWMLGREAAAPMTLVALGLEDRADLRLQLQSHPSFDPEMP